MMVKKKFLFTQGKINKKWSVKKNIFILKIKCLNKQQNAIDWNDNDDDDLIFFSFKKKMKSNQI